MKPQIKYLRFDAHAHALIGFQDYWQKLQGYQGRNLLQLIGETCFSKEIDICALTSEEFKIPRESVHDRLRYLIKNYARILPANYHSGKLGDNVFVIEKDGEKVYLVNSQTVIVQENDRRFDHLVVGANDVPNFMSLQDTLQYGKDHNLTQIAEHPVTEAHLGLGLRRLKENLDDYDAVEGHNSQLVIPAIFAGVPVIGPYSKKSNELAKQFAKEHEKPHIAVSDSHRIEDIGISYIEFNSGLLVNWNEERFLACLKRIIQSGNFENHEDYVSLAGWLDWTIKLKIRKKSSKVF